MRLVGYSVSATTMAFKVGCMSCIGPQLKIARNAEEKESLLELLREDCDKDNTGFMNVADFRHFMESLGQEDDVNVDEIIEKVALQSNDLLSIEAVCDALLAAYRGNA